MKINYLIITLLVLTSCTVESQKPTVWRNGTDGVYPATELLDQWPEEGPEILWAFEELGKGHSSPAIYNDYIYATGMIDTTGYLFKFDMDGSVIYKKTYGPEYTKSFYGTRGTPVIAGDKIYVISGWGMLYCMSEEDGEQLWTADMVNEYGGKVISWGYNETPVIDGDIIYATPGGKSNNIIALNRNTGKLVWSSKGTGELTAYCTPLLFTHNGRKILTTHTESFLMGIDTESGELLWKHKHPNKWSVHANTPIYHDGGIFFFSGYGQGAGKVMLNEEGTSVELVWSDSLDSRMGGAVLIDGYIYGSGDFNKAWRCIDWETGEDKYTSEDFGKGATIAADGKIFGYSDRGELALINVNPAKFDLVSKFRVLKGSEQHWSHPVIYNGVLYLRHGKALIAYKIS